MRVPRVLMPDGSESWTVLGPAGEPVGVVEAFLAHLQALDRSPTTVRTYATTLKLWLEFLDRLGVAADGATVDHVSRFVAWLRASAENVTVLDGGSGRCGPATVNRHLAALFTFYDYRTCRSPNYVIHKCPACRSADLPASGAWGCNPGSFGRPTGWSGRRREFGERDCAGSGDIERVDSRRHRDSKVQIRGSQSRVGQPGPLRTQYQRDPAAREVRPP
jgi:hypothetical protein